MKKIAVIGAGQLGSRHLQALAKLSFPVSISVVDSSMDSLTTAEARFREAGAEFKGEIQFLKAIDALPVQIDLVIVATGSRVRRAVVEQLLAQSKVSFLVLEKFLFTIEDDYSAVEKLLKDAGVRTWVNCPRRMMDFYNELKSEISGPVTFLVTGNNWGMGCNGIHLLDLFAFLTGGADDIILDSNLVDRVIHESKRPGYIEFTGSITGRSGRNSFQITSFNEKASGVQVIIHTPFARYSIEEGAAAKAWISRQEKNWEWEEMSFRMPFQSELTAMLAEQILLTGNCMLTTYQESAKLHRIYLHTLLEFLRKINNDNSIRECLVT